MEKETLEEFIDRVDTPADFDQFTFDAGIRVGAKWQAERMYSEEEVEKLLIYCKDRFGGSGLEDYTEDVEVKEWFEQFKKK